MLNERTLQHKLETARTEREWAASRYDFYEGQAIGETDADFIEECLGKALAWSMAYSTWDAIVKDTELMLVTL